MSQVDGEPQPLFRALWCEIEHRDERRGGLRIQTFNGECVVEPVDDSERESAEKVAKTVRRRVLAGHQALIIYESVTYLRILEV